MQISFKEYDTLRAEILARTTNGYQLIAVAAGAAAWLLSHKEGNHSFRLEVGTAVVAAGTLVYLISRDICLLSARIQEIEKEINGLAGADLLRWESKWGMGAGTPLIGKVIHRMFARSVKARCRE